MPELPLDERIAQLEKIVATQSEMILKLVEMMNHLGAESAATNERVEAARQASAEHFQKLAALLQKLVGNLDQDGAEA